VCICFTKVYFGSILKTGKGESTLTKNVLFLILLIVMLIFIGCIQIESSSYYFFTIQIIKLFYLNDKNAGMRSFVDGNNSQNVLYVKPVVDFEGETVSFEDVKEDMAVLLMVAGGVFRIYEFTDNI
jgi:hypothetical protein